GSAHHPRARRHVVRARLQVEGELRSALAELDGVVGRKLHLAGDPLAVEQGAVAAAEIGEPERDPAALALLDSDRRMLAADHVIPFRVIRDGRAGVAADQDVIQALQRNLLDLIGFRAAEVANDDSGFCNLCHTPLRLWRARTVLW